MWDNLFVLPTLAGDEELTRGWVEWMGLQADETIDFFLACAESSTLKTIRGPHAFA